MGEMLRTHIFGVFRCIILLVLALPESSTFRTDATFRLTTAAPTTMGTLSNNLNNVPEARELQTLLFELTSLHYELKSFSTEPPKSEAFIEAVRATLPSLVLHLSQTYPSIMDTSLVNAQLVFLSKLTAPISTNIPREALANPDQTLWKKEYAIKALEIVKESKFFGILMKHWPPEHDLVLQRTRAQQPTICCGLNLILNILHRDRRDMAIQDSVCALLTQHLVEFQTALKMGSERTIVDREWKPLPSDQEIGRLIQTMIQQSAVHKNPELSAQLIPLCLNLNAPAVTAPQQM